MIGTEGFAFCAYFIKKSWHFSRYFQNEKKKERTLPMVDENVELTNIDLKKELEKVLEFSGWQTSLVFRMNRQWRLETA